MELEDPSSWQRVRLSDLGEVNRGRSRHRPRHAPHLYGGPYPFVQTGDIKASGGRIISHRQTYSESGLAQSRLWPAGTMAITIAANIAETAILTYPACFPDSVIGFVADPNKCDVRFIEFMFRQLRRQIQHIASDSGTVQDNINLEFLEDLRFPLPPLWEQRALAHVLGVLDDKIRLNRRTNQTLVDLARSMFKSWFVDFDPVVAQAAGKPPVGMSAKTAALFPDSFQDSLLGPIPKGWRAGNVADLAKYVNGRNFTKNATGTGRMVIRIAELNSGPGDSTIFNDVAADPENIACPGDLLFAWSGSLDVYRWHGEEALINQHIFKVVSDTYPQWFVHHHLREAMAFFQGIAADKATTMGHIKREHLAQAEVALPPQTVLRDAGRILGPLYERVDRAELQCSTLAALRDTLLPRLMAGELRLAEAEQAILQST